MAESVRSLSEAEERRELEKFVPPLSRPRAPAVYGGRFTLAYLVLMLVFGGVAALTTYLVMNERSAEPWSAWQPRGEGIALATNIANHVAPKYRAGNDQLAVVEAQPPIVQDSPIGLLAVARTPRQFVGGGFITVERADRAVFYVLCGMGSQCSLANGDANETLLRREALELSLYTFKYMDDIDSVVTLLPPSGTELPAVYLRRRAYEKQLERPLGETLPARPPYTSASVADAPMVDRLTEHRIFPAYFQRISGGGVMLRLGGSPPEEEQGAGAGQNP
jgi:hypothetical protein